MGGGTNRCCTSNCSISKRKRNSYCRYCNTPFLFEGKVRQEQAKIGIEKLRKQVDSLIVINNNKLREVYGNLGFKAGFSKADEVLATASRGIAEVITHHYTQNIDLRMLRQFCLIGTAIISGVALKVKTELKKDSFCFRLLLKMIIKSQVPKTYCCSSFQVLMKSL
jgi:cell division protein FtsZ